MPILNTLNADRRICGARTANLHALVKVSTDDGVEESLRSKHSDLICSLVGLVLLAMGERLYSRVRRGACRQAPRPGTTGTAASPRGGLVSPLWRGLMGRCCWGEDSCSPTTTTRWCGGPTNGA
jgi:hypothetical protein